MDEAYLPKTESWPATAYPPLLLHILVESLLGYINIIEIRIRPPDPHYFVVFHTKMAVSNHLHGTQDLNYQVSLVYLLWMVLLLCRSLSQVCACLTDAHTWCRSWHSFIHSKSRLILVLLIVADQRPFAVLLNVPIPVVTEALLPHHTKHGHSPSQEDNTQLTKNNVKLQSRKAGCVRCRSLSFCHSFLSVLHFIFMHFLRLSFALHIHIVWRLMEDERIAGPRASVGGFLGAKDGSRVWQKWQRFFLCLATSRAGTFRKLRWWKCLEWCFSKPLYSAQLQQIIEKYNELTK